MAEYTVDVIGMTCKGCERIVFRAVTRLPGMETAEPDHVSGTVRVEGEPGTRRRVRRAIEDAGFKPTS